MRKKYESDGDEQEIEINYDVVIFISFHFKLNL